MAAPGRGQARAFHAPKTDARILSVIANACAVVQENAAKGKNSYLTFVGQRRGAAMAMGALHDIGCVLRKAAPCHQRDAQLRDGRITTDYMDVLSEALSACQAHNDRITVYALALYDRQDMVLFKPEGRRKKYRYLRTSPNEVSTIHILASDAQEPATVILNGSGEGPRRGITVTTDPGSARVAMRSFLLRLLAPMMPSLGAQDDHLSKEQLCFSSQEAWAYGETGRSFRRKRLSAWKPEWGSEKPAPLDPSGSQHTFARAEAASIAYSRARLAKLAASSATALYLIEHGGEDGHIDQSIHRKQTPFILHPDNERNAWKHIYNFFQAYPTLPIPLVYSETGVQKQEPQSSTETAVRTFRVCDINQIRSFFAPAGSPYLSIAELDAAIAKVAYYPRRPDHFFPAEQHNNVFLDGFFLDGDGPQTELDPSTLPPQNRLHRLNTLPLKSLRLGSLQLLMGALWTFVATRPQQRPGDWTGTWRARRAAETLALTVRQNIIDVVFKGRAAPEVYVQRCFLQERLCEIDPDVQAPMRPEPRATDASANIWHDPWLQQQLAVEGFKHEEHPLCYNYMRLHPGNLERVARATNQRWMDERLRFRETVACAAETSGGQL
ncbi:MAG: hypothetical protein ACPGUV_11070 [Polyangiales bacterium]